MKEQAISLKILNYEQSVMELINDIKDYILSKNCKDIEIDICSLSTFDAVKVATLCSAFHFTKYNNGNISWLVNSKEIANMLQMFSIKNINLTSQSQNIDNVISIEQKIYAN